MPSLFDLLARSNRDIYSSSRSAQISIRQQEMLESISNELIAEGLPAAWAGDWLAHARGFDVWPHQGRSHSRHRGGWRVHHGDHHDDYPVASEVAIGDAVGDGFSERVEAPESVVNVVNDINAETIGEIVLGIPVDLVEEDDTDGSIEHDDAGADSVDFEDSLNDVLDGYGDQDYELDSETIAEVVEEIDDPAADALVAGGDALTLTQVQQLFELYFNAIVNANVSSTSINNTTYVDQSDNSVTTYNIDNSVNALIDQSDSSVNGSFNSSVDNSVHDSFNSSIDNSVNIFELSYTEINLSSIITGERAGRDRVQGTSDDDLIGAGHGRDRLSGKGGADSFLFDQAGHCGRRQADVIRDFDAAEGDRILIDADSFDGGGTVAVADTRRQFRQMRKNGEADFLYFQPRGGLYYDANGEDRGFGGGGLMAALRGAPDLGADHIQLV